MQDNILPDKIKKRYSLIKMIGTGGMGNVYLAEDTELYRKVAIKAIKPELLENEEVQKRIEYECRMHAAIQSHPHIVTLYDRVVDAPNIFLIMEYVKGMSLAQLIKNAQDKKSPLPLSITINLLCQILDALKTIHKHGIIHRDIKPSNILIDQSVFNNPLAKLMDFGIAKNAEGYEQLTQITQIDTGGPGTPAYMAPERIDASTFGELCPATDLYSVGIIFYELLCLKPPFQGTMTEIFAGQLTRQPDLHQLKSFPRGIQKIILKALAKEPAERYADGESFSLALQNVLNPEEPTATAAPPFHEPRDKTMLSTRIAEFKTKPLQRTYPLPYPFSLPTIIGAVAILAIAFIIFQAVPELRLWNKQDISNEQKQKSNNSLPVQSVTGQDHLTKKTASPPGNRVTKPVKENRQAANNAQINEKKDIPKDIKNSTAALEALEQERKKKQERERLKREEERKKQMKELASLQKRQKTTKPKNRKSRRNYTRATKPQKNTYIVIPGQ